MIRLFRTASIARGKTGEAVAFAHKAADYVKEKHGLEFQVLMPIGGNPQRVAWFCRFNDLEDLEAMKSKLMSDPDYMNLAKEGSNNFIEGSIHDEIWAAI